MQFNVAGLLMDDEGAEYIYEINDEILSDINGQEFTNISGTIRLLRTDRTILVTGNFIAKSKDFCSRCLDITDIMTRIELEEEFSPVNKELMSLTRGVNFETDYDPTLVIDQRNTLDLSKVLGEAFSIAAPMAPLCKKSCNGLCQKCFVNLNENQCPCERDTNLFEGNTPKLAPDCPVN